MERRYIHEQIDHLEFCIREIIKQWENLECTTKYRDEGIAHFRSEIKRLKELEKQ